MAKECSFDVVSVLDLQEVDNAVNQTAHEIATRYDLKGSGSRISLDKTKGSIELEAKDDFHAKSVVDILQSKLVKRGVSLKALDYGKVEPAAGGTVRQSITLVQGIEQDQARALVKFVKDSKLSARTQIEGDKLRVSSKSKDVLQQVIRALKEHEVPIPLQFVNFRD
jgi:hypothetical protein